MEALLEANISMSDILSLMGTSRKPLLDAEDILDADHILLCGITVHTNDIVQIFCACAQSTRVRRDPYEVNITLTVADGIKEIKCSCTCTVGAGGRCKHAFAALLHVNRTKVCNLPRVSCTDVKQQWGKLTAKMVETYDAPTKLADLCHYGARAVKNVEKDYSHLNDFFLETLINGSEASEAAIHMSRVRNTNSTSKDELDLDVHRVSSPVLSTRQVKRKQEGENDRGRC